MTRRLARSAGLIGLATFSSRVLGLVRDQLFAFYFGTVGGALDAYIVAARVPSLLRDLFAEGAMSAAFVPTFTRYLTTQGKEAAWRLGSQVLNALLLVTAVLVVIGILFAEPFLLLFASGYGDDPEQLALTTTLTRITLPFLSLIAVAAALAGFAGGAHPAGFQLMEQNASGLGNAYSGQAAAAEDASTIFFNPAGMTRLPGKQAVGALNFIKPSAKFTDSGASRDAFNQPLGPGGGNGGDAGDLATVPNAYLSWQFSPQIWFGLGLSVPFGLKTEYDTTWIGRFQGQLAEVKTIDINPSIACKISDTVSIGAGISYQKGDVKVKRSTVLGPATEGRVSVDIDDDAFGFNLGVMFNLSPSTRIGLSYRSSMDYDLTGTLVIVPPAGASSSNNVRLDVELPDTWSVALAHQLNPQWEILADATFTNWSKIKSLPLVTTSTSAIIPVVGFTADTFEFQFKDSYRVGIGANWKWRGDFMWKFGVAYDKSPVEDFYRTVTLPDNDRKWLAVGGKYRMAKQAAMDFGYAHLFISDASINQNRTAQNQGIVSGTYKGHVDILSGQFSYSF